MATPAAVVGQINKTPRRKRRDTGALATAKTKLKEAQARVTNGDRSEDARKGLDEAQALFDLETKRDARARFERLAEIRTNGALKAINALASIARNRKYLFVGDDIETIVTPLKAAVANAETTMRESLAQDTHAAPATRITFAPLEI